MTAPSSRWPRPPAPPLRTAEKTTAQNQARAQCRMAPCRARRRVNVKQAALAARPGAQRVEGRAPSKSAPSVAPDAELAPSGWADHVERQRYKSQRQAQRRRPTVAAREGLVYPASRASPYSNRCARRATIVGASQMPKNSLANSASGFSGGLPSQIRDHAGRGVPSSVAFFDIGQTPAPGGHPFSDRVADGAARRISGSSAHHRVCRSSAVASSSAARGREAARREAGLATRARTLKAQNSCDPCRRVALRQMVCNCARSSLRQFGATPCRGAGQGNERQPRISACEGGLHDVGVAS